MIKNSKRFFQLGQIGRVQLIKYLAVFCLAFIVRSVFIWKFAGQPVNDLLWNDAVGWNLAQGKGFTASLTPPYTPGIFRTPLYPVFLAFVYFVAGHSYQAAYFAQATLDSVSALVLMQIASNLSLDRIGLSSGLLYAVYPYPAMFCGVLHQDILLTFATLLLVLFVIKAENHIKWKPGWLIVGILLGIVVMIKPFMLVLIGVPFLIILGNWGNRLDLREKLLSFALIVAGAAIVVSPWVARNYLVFNSFPPLAVGGSGTNLVYLLMEIEGGEKILIERFKVESIEEGSQKPETYLTGFLDGKDLIEHEKMLARGATSELIQKWPDYLILVIKHIPRLWLTKYTMGRSALITQSARIISILFVIAGCAGMLLMIPDLKKLLPLYLTIIIITLTYAFYTAEARYTLPVRPLMIVFIAGLLHRLLSRKI